MSVRRVESPIQARAYIPCKVSVDEKKHLLHKAGIVGNFIRMKLFFPFKEGKVKEGLSSAQDFWEMPGADPEYHRKEAIHRHFNRYNQSIVIKVDGKEIRLKCLVIESKGCSKEGALNHLIVQGNTSNLDNNMPGLYPFLDSYMKQKEGNENLPPGRFIIFNHYDNMICKGERAKEERYLPGDMDEWGFLFKKTIESFTNEYGRFQLITAHSLGNIPIVAQLKHLKKEEFMKFFPDTLFLAKGPSSLYEVSKNVPFEFGCYPYGWFLLIGMVLYYLAKWTGWTLELDETLVDKLKTLPKTEDVVQRLYETNLIVSQVKDDHYFPGKAGLASSKKLDQINDIVNLYRVHFKIPPTRTTKKGGHNFNPGLIKKAFVEKQNLYHKGKKIVDHKTSKEVSENTEDHHLLLKDGENIIDAVLRSAWTTSLASRGSLANRVSDLKVA